MAGPSKRRAIKNKESESGSDMDEDGYHGQEEIQADFEGRNPEAHHFHAIKQLLQQLFLKAHIDLSQLADLVIAQTGIGSVLVQSLYDDEDDSDDDMSSDAFGITSVINISSHKETPCIKQLIALIKQLSKEHADESKQKEIEDILSNKKVGLLLNERYVNIPAKIADPLLTSLMGEIDRFKKKDSSYDFDYYVMICKMHKSKQNKSEILFANAEEEIFAKEAKACFDFDVTQESDTSVTGKWSEDDVEMTPFRLVLFFEGNKFSNIVQQVKAFVN
ncbi:protein BCCIP homolog [Onthophagus taurus]|uniref:protein BCCIP homolog n=1 Tax=Onthophagus taurus TaxID=166361 RepID=UPI000C200096|nr:protein BCCIP homolog [Onthophagus taurus]